VKLLAGRLLRNKPYYFIASDDEAEEVSFLLQAVAIAKYFQISPKEVLETWTLSEMRSVLAVMDALTEFEKEAYENARR